MKRERLASTGGMETLRMSECIGIIAEDKSDIAVLKMIIRKYLDEHEFKVKKHLGKGSSGIRNKCGRMASRLKTRGCGHLFVVHDLDDHDEKKLRTHLESQIRDSGFRNTLILIPVLEIEAWLLSDPMAIKSTFHLKIKPKVIPNTENVSDPKKFLRDIVWQLGKKRYLPTEHNEKIAEKMSRKALHQCKSFLPLEKYIKSHLKN